MFDDDLNNISIYVSGMLIITLKNWAFLKREWICQGYLGVFQHSQRPDGLVGVARHRSWDTADCSGGTIGDTVIHVGGKALYRWKRKGGPFLKKEITSGRLFLSISPCRHMESLLNSFKCIFIMTVLVARQKGVDDLLSLIYGMPAHSDMRGFEV